MRIALFDADPGLLRGLPPSEAAALSARTVAPSLNLRTGPWEPSVDQTVEQTAFGILVLSGSLLREFRTPARSAAELVGPGDVVRPWGTYGDRAYWSVLAPGRAALLDRDFMLTIAGVPEVLAELAARAERRAGSLAQLLSICSLVRVEARVLALLWQLGRRYGSTEADGLLLALPLTQEAIGRLIGARRTSVSVAFTRLIESGALERRDNRTLLLRGEVGDFLTDLTSSRRGGSRMVRSAA